VHGDVIDITPLRTKLLETGVSEPPPVGSPATTDYWVKGRQPTGRVVAISNKASFDAPVYNYSAMWSFVWQEVMFPISYRDDWHAAERIIDEEAKRVSATETAREARKEMRRHYPLPPGELEPRVYVRATDNYMELSARFLVPVRTSRAAVNQLTRRIRERLDAEGITIASTTSEVTVRQAQAGGDK
jgi:small-conductance mechanosensitive channel